MNHIGIYLSNKAGKEKIIEDIISNNFLKDHVLVADMRGELFSTITIDRIIDEELKHDWFPVTSDENPSLMSMSSGQQRKALLKYIVSRNPQYIVLDDVFSSIDKETQQFITGHLHEISKSTLLIQLFYRKQDILDCIQTVLSVDGENKIESIRPVSEFTSQQGTSPEKGHILLPHLFAEPNPAVNPVVQLNGVSASYGDKNVLRDIHWTVQLGEFWQLIGPNGSGKTTLLSMIIGDNPKGYGQDMVLFGRKKGSGETIWDIKKQIGYFTPTMTMQFKHNDSVENMIISGLVDSVGLYTKPTDLQRDIAQAWLKVLGPTFRNKTFNALSFGQQRILMVVRAMVKHPPLLILDEPTVGLDDENARLFTDLVTDIASQKKIAIIYVSHRTEPELNPEKIFELVPSPLGSTGVIKTSH
jgi:ABC-type molybdenum transport system, ATPase component/photorepair protein PhrA